MIKIKLSHNEVTLIDDEDFELVSQHKWYAYRIAGTSRTGKVYLYGFKAGKKIKLKNGKYKKLWLHNFLMNPPRGYVVDHIDGNPLNNQRNNLRVVTQKQNLLNRGKRRNGKTSKYLGVHKRGEKYIASIKLGGKQIHLGYFNTEEDAAYVYNESVKVLFGEYARLNKIS